MLILTIHKDGKLHIGDDVVLTVLKATSGKVTIGTEAPQETSITRLDTIDKPNGSFRSDNESYLSR